MKLSQNTRVTFNEDFHFYLLDGEKVPLGVTTLMKKHGLGHQYDIPANYTEEEWQAILDHAAEIGTMAHKCIESYCNGEATVLNPLIKSFKKLKLNIVATEYLVSDNDVVASSIDLVEEVEDGVFNLIDMKRTSTLHEDSLYWQLGAYKYLFLMANPEAKVKGCYALHIKKGNKDDIDKDTVQCLKEVKVASEQEIMDWFDAERLGFRYEPQSTDVATINADAQAIIVSKMPLLMELQEKLKPINDAIEEAKSMLYEEMLSKGIEEVSVGGYKIKLKKPSQRSSFDSKTFKETYPDLADKYTKTSEVKGSVLITPIK